jgi:hypothetical protein
MEEVIDAHFLVVTKVPYLQQSSVDATEEVFGAPSKIVTRVLRVPPNCVKGMVVESGVTK